MIRELALHHFPEWGPSISLAHVRYCGTERESWMVIPRTDNSFSNCFTAGEISLSPTTITAHSKFPLSSRVTISHWLR